MLYPNTLYTKLGFDQVLEQLTKECVTEMGRAQVANLKILDRQPAIIKYLTQVKEFIDLKVNNTDVTIAAWYDLRPYSAMLGPEGVYLSLEELAEVLTTARQAIRCLQELNAQDVEGELRQLAAECVARPAILTAIGAILDEQGELKENASKLLAELTAEAATFERRMQGAVARIFKNASDNGWTGSGSITMRNGHLCVPVLAEHKRKVRGFVLDESATGQTLYVQPDEIIELDNRLREVMAERKKEIVRLLKEVAGQLAPYKADLDNYTRFLTRIEVVQAKAGYALKHGCVMPEVSDDPEIFLINAKNVVLEGTLNEAGRSVVPLNIRIDATDRIIVVSGPNAGGKSVCMKTVGLTQLMFQAGLLIPADARSRLGVFKNVFADIGDDQSLESDLSTYSAHLTKMKYFIKHANERTLILIDEFGTGTDPHFGGPIAEAVLQKLNGLEVRGVVTTHYSNLKHFAENTAGLTNASMLFNNQRMQPMFILEIGKPGSSYAFEIAQNIGLPHDVIALAREKTGEETNSIEKLLIRVERDKKLVLDERAKLKNAQNQARQLLDRLKEREEFFTENKNNLLREAKAEARKIITEANKLVENTISGIKAANADSVQTKALRAELKLALAENEAPQQPAPVLAGLAVGDWVKITGTETVGQVKELHKNTVTITMGNLITVAKLSQVEKVSRSEIKKQARSRATSLNSNAVAEAFTPELDLRGLRGDEALASLEKYMDRALVLGVQQLRILHGKGDGILRRLVRDYLKVNTSAVSITDEHLDRGGDGITLVTL